MNEDSVARDDTTEGRCRCCGEAIVILIDDPLDLCLACFRGKGGDTDEPCQVHANRAASEGDEPWSEHNTEAFWDAVMDYAEHYARCTGPDCSDEHKNAYTALAQEEDALRAEVERLRQERDRYKILADRAWSELYMGNSDTAQDWLNDYNKVNGEEAYAILVRETKRIQAENLALRRHHNPDAPTEHICEDCDNLQRERDRYRQELETCAAKMGVETTSVVEALHRLLMQVADRE